MMFKRALEEDVRGYCIFKVCYSLFNVFCVVNGQIVGGGVRPSSRNVTYSYQFVFFICIMSFSAGLVPSFSMTGLWSLSNRTLLRVPFVVERFSELPGR